MKLKDKSEGLTGIKKLFLTFWKKNYFLEPYESFPSWTGDSVCGADARLSLCTDPLKICDKKSYLGR